MKENIDKAIEWIKDVHTSEYNVRGCITGSYWLGFFEDQDIDLFVYDEASLRNILYAMYYDPMFQILDKTEKWKFEKFINSKYDKKQKILTIKFMYNVSVPINIILKTNATSIYSVLESFDLDIVCKGYDLETSKYLDLREGSADAKVGSWNKYNTSYYNPELWEASRILRQISRGIKYYKRGYNTDPLMEKYVSIAEEVERHQNIFGSKVFGIKLKAIQDNIKLTRKICLKWLETHEISDEELEILETKIKEI